MTLDDLLAREGIRDTIATYNLAGDAARVDDITDTFADDCELVLMDSTLRGKAAVRAFYEQRRLVRLDDERQGRPGKHFLSTQRIDITGPTQGTATSYFLFVRQGQVEQMGTYRDRFTKIGERWLISHRHVDMGWIAP